MQRRTLAVTFAIFAAVTGVAVGVGGAAVMSIGTTSPGTDHLAEAKPVNKLLGNGTDTMASIAQVQVKDGRCDSSAGVDSVDLVGDTTVRRGPVVNKGFDTEMLQLSLTGYGTQVGDVSVRLSPTRPTIGRVSSANGHLPADSFFDVFFEIEVLGGTLHNEQPVHMAAAIFAIPPIGTRYEGAATPVPVLDAQGREVACIIHAAHVPEDPSHALIKKELIQHEKKLDRLLRAHGL